MPLMDNLIPVDMPLVKRGMMRGAGCILMQRKQKERNSSIPVISIQSFCTPTHNKQ